MKQIIHFMAVAFHTISSKIHEFIAVLMFNESEYPKKMSQTCRHRNFYQIKNYIN